MMYRHSRTAALLLALLIWLSIGSLVLAQEMGEEGQDCWACHRQPNLNGIEGARVDIALCQDCHSDPAVDQGSDAGRTPLHVDPAKYGETVHSEVACVACHSDVARNPHRTEELVACADCHATLLVHVNMGAPHVSSDCAACHLTDLPVVQDRATGRVMLASTDAAGVPVDRTGHDLVKEAGCEKCHVAGNAVGAPAVGLPARSIFCMVCHDASPNISVALLDSTPVTTDYGAILGLVVLSVGMVVNLSLYLRGEIPGHPGLTAMQKLNYVASDVSRLIFSRRVCRFVASLVADGILLRRVLRESVGRWVMHTLIYLPFLARLGLGLLTWIGQVFWPSAAWTQTLSNKDAPGVAFAYDFLTLLMILGVLFALFRRFVLRDRRLPTFAQDKVAIFLLGAILLVGIITEGVRLLSANTPQSIAVYSFLGYAVAAVLRSINVTWTSLYPVVWYLHAWLAVAFIAYLPFSKFMHILAGPFIASLDAARKGRH